MAFFEIPSVEKLLELHIKRLRELEDEETERIIGKYREIRGELSDRLRSIRRDTFSAQQLRGDLAQVDSAIQAMNTGR
jgi:hypothetical protein